jgi:NAD(P)-dependent dehydrogenase (short-subunit alcohol dehydrogenase family)
MSHVLQGKIAVVTGGSGGVGQAGALGLGEAGATVSLTGHTVHEDSGLPCKFLSHDLHLHDSWCPCGA